MSREKAIELVNEILSKGLHTEKGKDCSSWCECQICRVRKIALQVLAELQKQPLAGDFRKKVQAWQKEHRYSPNVTLHGGTALAVEACVIIDQQAEDNKDLHREYQDLAAINLKLQTENDEMFAIYRRYRQYPELQAEIDGLKEQIAVMYDEAQAENVTLMSKNEQLRAEIERRKEEARSWRSVAERLEREKQGCLDEISHFVKRLKRGAENNSNAANLTDEHGHIRSVDAAIKQQIEFQKAEEKEK